MADERPALALALLRASDWFDDALRARLAAGGGPELTRSQALVFGALRPDGESIAGLARTVGVTRQSMHRTVTELAAAGLLRVDADPGDGRASTVRLTARGDRLVRRAAAELREVEQRLADRVGEDAVAALRGALGRDWGPPPTR